MGPMLTNDERRALLRIARFAIVESLVHERTWKPEPAGGKLEEPHGAFVTLEQRGRLRGCVGQPTAQGSLVRTVAHCAVAAAREDGRFRPVLPADVGELTIEISVLSSMEAVEPAQIEIGKHGLLVVQNDLRGLLLPRVAAERSWTTDRFLQETCRKAGLPLNAWEMPGTQVFCFTAEEFGETDFAADNSSPIAHSTPQTRSQ
jgi:AmmeMemoRadiSam system protein A